MRLPRVAATLAFACTLTAGVAAPRSAAAQPTTPKSTAHKKKHHSSAKRQPSQKAPTADRITEIQSALSRQGYYEGDPSGKMDSKTVAALQKFQSASGMDATGKLDAPTLQKLGLGSDTAGISAPKPAAPPSCCSMMTPASAPASPAPPAANSTVAQSSPAPSTADRADVH